MHTAGFSIADTSKSGFVSRTMSKASKLRPCPALGRDITPADCGEQRQSRLACPENCPHNPFAPANYSQLLEIEDRMDRKTIEKFVALTPNNLSFEVDLARAERGSIHAVHALFAWNLFFATDASQATFAERWERIGLDGLKNDERILLRGKALMRVALLEIHRVTGSGLIEAVDLLAPDPVPFILQDRSLAQIAVRFTTLLAWIFPLPHFWRLSGTAVTVPDMAQFSAREIVHEIVRHLGGPSAEPEMRRWLAEHFVEFSTAQDAVAQLRRRRILTGMDARFGKAVYEVRALFAQCRKWLDTLPDVSRDALSEPERDEGFVEARVWFDSTVSTKHLPLPGGQMVLGRILLGQSHWRLEAIGSDRLSRLRQLFEHHLGDRVRFSSERIDDLGIQMSARSTPVDESLAPPSLLQTAEKMMLSSSRSPALPPGVSPDEAENEVMLAAERAFIEDNIPALEGRTPREAARDPALRPKLVQLMKQRLRLHDERNLQKGLTGDINWMLLELDLRELIFDPPPMRAPITPSQESDPGDQEPADDGEISIRGAMRPPPPLLPAEPFDFDEAMDRLQAGIDAFETAAEADAELYASGSTILDDAEELTLEDLTENEFCFAVPFLIQTWFALVPPGCRSPAIGLRDLEPVFVRNIEKFQSGAIAKTLKDTESFLQTGPQPAMMMALLDGLLDAARTAPKKIRPTVRAQLTTMALLASLLEILDKALRPQ